jgi:PEP-CTERM motif-containing protein
VLAPQRVQQDDSWAEPLVPDTLSDVDPVGDRQIYAYSVVPGGVYNGRELSDALTQDPAVAEHYGDIDPSAFRVETVEDDRLVYVSYRKNDHIYWTKNKVILHRNEKVLTDGTQQIRARCGNRISDTPGAPVADTEPSALELDRLIADDTPPGPALVAGPVPDRVAPNTIGPVGPPAGVAVPTGIIPAGPLSLSTGTPGPDGPPPGLPDYPTTVMPLPGWFPTPDFPPMSDFPPLTDPELPIPPGLEIPPELQPPGGTPPTVGPPNVVPPNSFPEPPGGPPSGGPNPPTIHIDEIPPVVPPLDNPVPVPEPGTFLLVGGGAAAALFRRLRKK